MVIPKPVWSFSARKQLYQWYGHVHLERNHVVGQWFALRRSTGDCLWERRFHRANTVFHISGDVILASEMRSDGPWTADFGCNGISLETGDLVWRWYGKGLWGKFVRALDWIPGFTNDLRASFVGVRGSECATDRGHILDLATGKWSRKEGDLSSWKAEENPRTTAEKLYNRQQVELSKDNWLSGRNATLSTPRKFVKPDEPFGFRLVSKDGDLIWDWGVEQLGLHPLTSFYGWRLLGAKLLLLAGEEPEAVPIDPAKPMYVKPNPTKYHLVVLDALSGRVLQRLQASADKVIECRIEDADERGFLLSNDNKHLRYFAFAPVGD